MMPTNPNPELTFLITDLRRVQQALSAKLPAIIDGTAQARGRGHHRTAIALAGAHGGLAGAVSTLEMAIAELADAIAYHEGRKEET